MENKEYRYVGGIRIDEATYQRIRIEARNEALKEAFDLMGEVIRMGSNETREEPLRISVTKAKMFCQEAREIADRKMDEYATLVASARQRKESIEKDYQQRIGMANIECNTKKREAEVECHNMLRKAREEADSCHKEILKELAEREKEIKELKEQCDKNLEESRKTRNAAYAERELVIQGINQENFLVEIGKLKKEFKHIDSLAYDGKEAELKNEITELKREIRKSRTGESNNPLNRRYQLLFDSGKLRQDLSVGDELQFDTYSCLYISDIASAYFELASENITNNVMKVGLDESLRKLLELRKEVEWRMHSIEVKFKEDYIQKKLQLIKTIHALETYKALRKEEIQAERERLREEARAQREYERERRAAEKDEETARRKIEEMQRKAETERGNAERYARYEAQIAELNQALQTAIARQERALSMAQQTRRGFVYVISNIGSFGEGIYKIGLTRRLDPQERVDELGDASVPFRFDVHAMIESEDAPALENALHQAFADRKLNKVNGRKEFFRVTLEEVEEEVRKSGIQATFVKDAYAREYRDSLLYEKTDL